MPAKPALSEEDEKVWRGGEGSVDHRFHKVKNHCLWKRRYAESSQVSDSYQYSVGCMGTRADSCKCEGGDEVVEVGVEHAMLEKWDPLDPWLREI